MESSSYVGAKDLFASSTISGMRVLCSFERIRNQKIWLSIVILSSIGLVILCTINYLDYASYTVHTNIGLDVPVGDLDRQYHEYLLPDLGFCNHRTMKRSLYHHDELARSLNYKINVKLFNGNQTTFEREFNRYCPMPIKAADNADERVDPGLLVNGNPYESMLELYAQAITSRRDILIDCKWRGRSFPCNLGKNPPMFSEIYTDDSLCFLFHYDEDYIANLTKTEMIKRPRKISDLSLLIDIKQHQRCGMMEGYMGEGLFVSPTSKRTLLHTNLRQSKFLLHPGFEYFVKFKMLKITRLTDHLGRCRSKPFYTKNKSATMLEYTKTTCQSFAFVKDIFSKCGCLIVIPQWTIPYLNEQNLGFSPESKPSCNENLKDLTCMFQNLLLNTFSSWSSDDHRCAMDACSEIRYLYTFSSKNKLTKMLVGNFNFSMSAHALKENSSVDAWLKNNVIAVHINFETEKIDTMTEIQVFTFKDLVLYIGWNGGLFFGMSYISFFELMYIVSLIVGYTIRKFLSSTVMTKDKQIE